MFGFNLEVGSCCCCFFFCCFFNAFLSVFHILNGVIFALKFFLSSLQIQVQSSLGILRFPPHSHLPLVTRYYTSCVVCSSIPKRAGHPDSRQRTGSVKRRGASFGHIWVSIGGARAQKSISQDQKWSVVCRLWQEKSPSAANTVVDCIKPGWGGKKQNRRTRERELIHRKCDTRSRQLRKRKKKNSHTGKLSADPGNIFFSF